MDDVALMRRGLFAAIAAAVCMTAACVGGDPNIVGPGDDGSSGQDSAMDGGGEALVCNLPQVLCGDAGCVDPTTNVDHCGACSAGCGSGTCTDGLCSARLVFVTAAVYPGDLGGLPGADVKCNSIARATGLRGRYKAWLSHSTENVDIRLEHAVVPYRLPSGQQIAADWDELVDADQAIEAPINETQSGSAPTGTNLVWTGTQSTTGAHSGGGTSTCNDWRDGTGGTQAVSGDRTSIGLGTGDWTRAAGAQPCIEAHHLYCFEQR